MLYEVITLAGGVSANSGLRESILAGEKKYKWKTFIPKFAYTTDNAAMVAINGFYKYIKQEFVGQEVAPYSRVQF